ncbi:MAG: phosphoglycerate kinase [Chlamydiae bacterium]|nr:phosphoglycerate kinase [Chlamydiota bacterium]
MTQLNELKTLAKMPCEETVLLRVDLNVPTKDGVILDDSKIRACLPTIEFLHAKCRDTKIVLLSHLGRPDGGDDKLSLKPVQERLEELLGREVLFCKESIGPEPKFLIHQAKPGSLILLENLRFYPEEKKGDFNFAKQLSELGDVYINDAFAVSHRNDASVAVLPELFPKMSFAGFLLDKEILLLTRTFKKPEQPFIAIIGGSKLSSKLPLIESLIEKADTVIIGGLMAYTFLKARGENVGATEVEEDFVDQARKILLSRDGRKIVLPVDQIVVDADGKIFESQFPMPEATRACDIGSGSVELFKKILSNSKTVLWNGPMGIFEQAPFEAGSKSLIQFLDGLKATKIAGGGDTLHMVESLQGKHAFSWLSTGGGAMVEYITKMDLPSLKWLSE